MFEHASGTRERRWADTDDLVGCQPATVRVPLALSFQLMGVPGFDLISASGDGFNGDRMPQPTAKRLWKALKAPKYWSENQEQMRQTRAGTRPNEVFFEQDPDADAADERDPLLADRDRAAAEDHV